MSFIGKVLGNGSKLTEKAMPSFRFGGFQVMGAATREADTRTTKQLLDNIDYFAERLPEIAQFKKELKEMNPQHLGLVSDICELGSCMEMLPTNINIRKNIVNGKNLLTVLMEKLPKASKENPEMLNFTQEVINQTDTTTSKYFLASFANLFEHPEASAHLKVTKPLVKDIAQAALSGEYTMDYSKEKKFVNILSQYINPSVEPEKIKMISELGASADKLPESLDLMCEIYPEDIIGSKIPTAQMKENLETFSQIAEGLAQKTKTVNLSDFVTKNVNLY